MSLTAKRTIDSLARAFDLLEIVAERGEVKLAELPGLLGVSRATAFRVLTTLQQRGYIEHLRDSSTYRLGPGSVILAARSQTASIVRRAEPVMAELRHVTGETVNLALFRGGQLVYVAIFDGSHAMRMSGTIGERVPLHSTAVGKATLASVSRERVRALLGPPPFRRFTEQTLTTMKALEADLEETRRRGYAVDREEMDVGARCVGVAILGVDGEPLGGLSVSGLAVRIPPERQVQYGDAVVRACRSLGEQFTHAE
jgi:IclR family transcriptional regulator, acetate operon repressor